MVTSIGNIVLGGKDNSINTNFAIAGGSNIQIQNDIADTAEMFTFAWGNRPPPPAPPTIITQGNSFIVYVDKFGVNVPNPTHPFEMEVAPGKKVYISGINDPAVGPLPYEFGPSGPGDWCNALNECLSKGKSKQKSDLRLKRNVQPITGALATLSRLRGVTFYWNERYKFHAEATTQQIGFIAQEVEKIFPQWVRETKAGIKKINTFEMNAVLVEAIKELNTIVDAETSKYDSLLDAKMKEVEQLSAELMPSN